MSSLADLPELVGFFSYSREDDEGSYGALSALRERIQHELRAQLGRSMKSFRLWQDKEAIAAGRLWETEIKSAVAQSAFFIPIITPTVVRSPFCRFELESFLAREAELGREDLVFPMLYIRVPAMDDAARLTDDPVLSIIARRQYVDWRELRLRDVNSMEVKEAVERLCANICDALHRPWTSPQERDAAAVLQQAEEERRRREAEAKGRDQEAREQAQNQARERADAEQHRREAEAARRQAEAAAEQEERQRQSESAARLRAEAGRAFETAKRADDTAAMAKFLAAYPQSEWTAEAERLQAVLVAREQAHSEAIANGDPAALQAFLKAYPQGAQADDVRRRLRRLEPRPPWRPSPPLMILAALLVLVVIGTVTWGIVAPTPKIDAGAPALVTADPTAQPRAASASDSTDALAQVAAAAAPAAPNAAAAPPAPVLAPVQATQILDSTAVRRLKANKGVALQWISWDYLGRLTVTDLGGVIHLDGSQTERNGPGRLQISGDVVSIDQASLTFQGSINIYAAPSDRKECLRNGVFQFAITGSRHYWRLQQMEACDGLTDYVDIFF